MQQSASIFCEIIKGKGLENIRSSDKSDHFYSNIKNNYYYDSLNKNESIITEGSNMLLSHSRIPSISNFINRDSYKNTEKKESGISQWKEDVGILKTSLEEKDNRCQKITTVDVNDTNLKRLEQKTTIELEKYSHHLPDCISKKEATKIIKETNHKLSELSFTKLSIELTPSKIMKYRFSLSNNILLTLFKPFEKVDVLGNNGVMYDLCVDETSIRSGFADLDSLIKASNFFVINYQHQ